MRRKKRLLTRRRRALRCAAAALVLLILAQTFLHTALLLPIQVIRRVEDQQGVQGARVVRRQWEPKVYNWTNLFYLTANDETVLFTNAYITARTSGWGGGHTVLLDCTAEKPIHAAQKLISEDTGPGKDYHCYGIHYFFFGRVDDPSIETAEIRLQVNPGYEGAAVENVSLGYLQLTVPIFQRNGRRYFLAHHYVAEAGLLRDGGNHVIGKDREGNTVTTLQIEETSYASTSVVKGSPKTAEERT